jgi:hypothetical protein
MVDLSLQLLWSLFTTVPGLVIVLVLLFASFVSGIAYTRRALRNNPEGFAQNVLKAKELTAEARARWHAIVDSLKS